MGISLHHRSAVALLFALLAHASAALAADLYVSGALGISNDTGASGGATTVLPGPPTPNSGKGRDASPVFGGALGFAVPLDVAIPWRGAWRPPSWDLRLELEGRGGRDSELTTSGVTPQFPFHTQVSSWSVMGNLWLDVPIYKPLSMAFGRVPMLEPVTWYLGLGVGLGGTKLATTDSNISGSNSGFNLAYQAGTGLGYALTDRVDLSLGYRYVDLGTASTAVFDSTGGNEGNYTLGMASHEFGTSIRIHFYSVPFARRSRSFR